MLQSKIKTVYEKHSGSRVCQGDIYRDFSFSIVTENAQVMEISFPYILVLSQDCDLDHGFKEEGLGFQEQSVIFNQFLPNILFAPAFVAESLRAGAHLENIYNIKQQSIDTKRWKVIEQNKNERYHYLPAFSEEQVPELVIDFKAYFTLPINIVYHQLGNYYLITLNELFRENLNQRFSFYLSRIGLPEIACGVQ